MGMTLVTDQTLRPIETHYRGYRFRSRLEAWWAVFFDALGIRWEYEPEGYETAGGRYLPDFWLPREQTWVEVKPQLPDPEDDAAWRRVHSFAEAVVRRSAWGRKRYRAVWLLAGYESFEYSSGYEAFDLANGEPLTQCLLCGRLIRVWPQIVQHAPCERRAEYVHCEWCNQLDRITGWNAVVAFYKGDIWAQEDGRCLVYDEPMASAYHAARGARFEHGESGAAVANRGRGSARR
jgi:hypothetical protein